MSKDTMKTYYTIPFQIGNETISLLITQGRTQKGYVSLTHFQSASKYITWNVVVLAKDSKLFHFREVRAAYELAMKVVVAKSVDVDAVLLEVA